MTINFIKQQYSTMPMVLKPWLNASGSLTQLLKKHGQGQFKVQLIAEGFMRPTVHEALQLGIPTHQYAWIREVNLYGNLPDAWVFARSIVPLNTMNGQGRQLKRLNNRSLGSLLFNRRTPAFTRKIKQTPQGWARQNCYTWHGAPILVQEIFLPAFVQTLVSQ